MKKKKAPLPRKHSSLGNYYCNCLHTPPITEMNNKLSALTGSFPLPLPLSAAPYRRARGAARAAGRTPRTARAPAQGARGLFPRHRPRRAGKDRSCRPLRPGRAGPVRVGRSGSIKRHRQQKMRHLSRAARLAARCERPFPWKTSLFRNWNTRGDLLDLI